jgi:hypothetical protein
MRKTSPAVGHISRFVKIFDLKIMEALPDPTLDSRRRLLIKIMDNILGPHRKNKNMQDVGSVKETVQ